MGDNMSSSICLTFAAWHRRPGGDSCQCHGLNRLSKSSPSPPSRSVHASAALIQVVLCLCFKCDYQRARGVQVSRTRYVSMCSVRLGRRPPTLIQRMSNVGLMKPVTVSWRFALTWKSLIGNDTNPNESVSFAEASVIPIQCMPKSLPGNSYIPLIQSHCSRLIHTFCASLVAFCGEVFAPLWWSKKRTCNPHIELACRSQITEIHSVSRSATRASSARF